MTKRVIYLCLIVIAVSAFASEKEVIPSTNVTPDFSLSTEQVETVQTGRRGRKSKRVKTPEQYVAKSFNNIFIGSTLFAYSIPTIPAGILGVYGCVIGIDDYIKTVSTGNYIADALLFSVTGLFLPVLGYALLAFFAAAVPIGLFVCGLVFWGMGNKRYNKYSPLSQTNKIFSTISKRAVILDRIGISTGITAGVGALLTGGGVAALVVNNHANLGYSDALQTSGVILSVFGGIGLAALPLMISSLGMSAWLKHEECRYSVDIGAVNKDEMQFCMRIRF